MINVITEIFKRIKEAMVRMETHKGLIMRKAKNYDDHKNTRQIETGRHTYIEYRSVKNIVFKGQYAFASWLWCRGKF